MKGVVFNLLEDAVCEHHGDDAWDALLDAAELSGVYTSLGSYSDAEMGKLVEAASRALNAFARGAALVRTGSHAAAGQTLSSVF